MLVFCDDSHQIKVPKISKSLTIIQDALKQRKKKLMKALNIFLNINYGCIYVNIYIF